MKRNGPDPHALLDAARRQVARNHHKKATTRLVEALEATVPGEDDGLLQHIATELIACAEATGEWTAVSRGAEKLFAGGVREHRLVRLLTDRLYERGPRQDLEALEVYVTALELGVCPSEREGEVQRLLAHAFSVELTMAPELLQPIEPLLLRLNAARPNLVFPLYNLGRFHYVRREFDVAGGYLARVGGHLAETPRLLNLRARCAEKTGRLDEALELYRASLGRDRLQPHVHYRIGRILLHHYVDQD